VLLAGGAFQFVFLYGLPSLRRIGISPLGIVTDVGVVRTTYPWNELRAVTRTSVTQHSGNGTRTVTRTRIQVGHGLRWQSYALTPSQGDRLARFLRIE
ncbi:MAG: hypothetical protein ACREEC_05445, partial [Thermoplasmata archaeon]